MPTVPRLASRFSLLRLLVLPALLILASAGLTHGAVQPARRILVFSKTAGFRHQSIEAGIAAIKKFVKDHESSAAALKEGRERLDDLRDVSKEYHELDHLVSNARVELR